MEYITEALETLKRDIEAHSGRKFGKVELTFYPIRGQKLGYAHKFTKGAATIGGKIAIDSRYAEWGTKNADNRRYVIQTLKHEVAHLIAETENTKAKGVWHGKAWKEVFADLGGDGARYNTSGFIKPENEGKEFKPMRDLYQIKPTQPADNWERGTFRQWLERGYHVMKGQKGTPVVWEFAADEYETTEDGKTSRWGRASAVYFTPDQVEANK